MQSLINADQNHGIDPKYPSMTINDRWWSAMGNDQGRPELTLVQGWRN